MVLLSRPALGTSFVGLANYIEAIRISFFRQVFAQTLYFVVVSLAIELVIGMGLALLLHRRFPGRGLVRGLILLPWMMSPLAAAFSWAWLLNDAYGLVNYLLLKVGLLNEPCGVARHGAGAGHEGHYQRGCVARCPVTIVWLG